MVQVRLFLTALSLVFLTRNVEGFTHPPVWQHGWALKGSLLHTWPQPQDPPRSFFMTVSQATQSNNKNNNTDKDSKGATDRDPSNEFADSSVHESDAMLLQSLQQRVNDLDRGIGKRYKVRTQLGFLNVHASFEDGPWATHNIVAQLEEGEIVTSVGPRVDEWVRHDRGGWSVAEFGGFVWLEPVDE